MVDATGEGWVLHPELMIVSPLSLKKRWKKIEVIRLFNESHNARRIGAAYPEAHIPRRSLARIIAEVAVLATYTQPHKPVQRPEARVSSPRPVKADVRPTHVVMDRSERIVSEYLSYRGFRDVVYEADGNVPPDFLLNGCIAVEVRRLNQNEDKPDGPRGLEEAAIPLQAKVSRLLRTLGPSDGGESWYVVYTFRRPLLSWDELANALRFELGLFRCDPEHQPTTRNIAQGVPGQVA
jgi:hypothetical protein